MLALNLPRNVSVWEGYDPLLEREVRVTRLRAGERCGARWLAEASAPWTDLVHPNLVNLYQVGGHEESIYLVCERVEGWRLTEVLTQDGPLTATPFRRMVEALVSALHWAHSHKVAHGSLHMDAVLFCAESVVRLRRWSPQHLSSWLDDWSRSIPTVMFFQAPEQIRGEMNQAASDVYGLGMLMYRALTGKSPFVPEDLADLCYQILTREPAGFSLSGDYPAPLRDVVMRCLAKNASERPSSVLEILQTLYPDSSPAAGEDPISLNNRGVELSLREGPLAGKSSLEMAVRQRPHDPVVRSNLAWALQELGEAEAAEEQVSRALLLELLRAGQNTQALDEAEYPEPLSGSLVLERLERGPQECWRGGDNRCRGDSEESPDLASFRDLEWEVVTLRAAQARTEPKLLFNLPVPRDEASVYVDHTHHRGLDRTVTVTRFEESRGCTAEWLAAVAGRWTLLHHPGIVPIYDFASFGPTVCIVSEPIEAQNLREFLEGSAAEGRKLGPVDFRKLVVGLASAMHHAHTRRVLHGNLSLDAVVLAPDDSVKVLRFPTEHLTAMLEGWVLAPIPSFMYCQAPEQFTGWTTVRSEIYAFGVILYRAIAGRYPFEAGDVPSLKKAILAGGAPRLEIPRGFPCQLGEVIRRCLSEAPERRPQSLREVLEAIYPGAFPEAGEETRRRQLHRRAQEAMEKGLFSRAAGLWEECLVLEPRDGVAANNLGAALVRLERFEEAEQMFRTALPLLPPGCFTLALNLGWSLCEQGAFVEAIPHLTRAAALHPQHAEAFHLLGRCKSGHYALCEYNIALNLDQERPDTHWAIADELEAWGNTVHADLHRELAKRLPERPAFLPLLLSHEPPRGWENEDNWPRGEPRRRPKPPPKPRRDDGGGGALVPRRGKPVAPSASEAKAIPEPEEEL